MLRNTESVALDRLARQYMPGPQTNLRSPANIEPMFFVRGQGARLWDVDDNEFLDFVCGYGPGVLGYGNQEYASALKRQIDSLDHLYTGDFRLTIENDLAEKVVNHVPCADSVRFCVTGSETVQLAIRLARAFTGRSKFIRFDGHYHGWLDNVLGGVLDPSPRGRPFALRTKEDRFYSEGVAPGALEESFKLPWNDAEALEEVLSEYGDEVAMVLMEPILINRGCANPRPGYLERVRELCTDFNVILCFDEIQSGFRVGLSGGQGLVGVTPDIATFGKAIGGGQPIGAVAGRRDVMELLYERRVIGAGTFNGHPLSLAGALATLTILERDDGVLYQQVDSVQSQLMDGLAEICRARGLPVIVQGFTGVFFLLIAFSEVDSTYGLDMQAVDWAKQERFEERLTQSGLLVTRGGKWYVSTAVTPTDVKDALRIVDEVVRNL